MSEKRDVKKSNRKKSKGGIGFRLIEYVCFTNSGAAYYYGFYNVQQVKRYLGRQSSSVFKSVGLTN